LGLVTASRIWVGIGLFFLIINGISGIDLKTSHFWRIDATELSLLAFTAIGLLLPAAKRLKIFGQEIEIERVEEYSKRRTEQVRKYSEVVEKSNKFLQTASDSLLKVTAAIEDCTTKDEVADRFVNYCKRRMSELSRWFDLPDEAIRLSVWLYSKALPGLFFLTSNEIADDATVKHVFRPGKGLMSRCFEENKLIDLPDAPKERGSFEAIAGAQAHEFHGLMLVPIRRGDSALGVLSVDRQKPLEFGENAERVSQVIANNIGVALTAALAREEAIARATAKKIRVPPESDATGLPPDDPNR